VIYICIPVHNEEATIGVLLWKTRKVMAEFGRDYRVLVLDDASTDGTAEVVQRYTTVIPISFFRSGERLGYPKALDRLLRKAVAEAPYPKRDAVVTLQGDFSDDPADIVSLVKALEGGADVVAGVPAGMDGTEPRTLRLARWTAGWLLRGTLRDSPVSDPFSGLRAYRVVCLKKTLREMDETPLLDQPGWAGNLQLLGAVAPHARRFAEASTESRPVPRARESRFRAIAAIQDLMKVRGSVDWRPAAEEG
jgi:glycosyltransferase involved in cell wall biosynthesis